MTKPDLSTFAKRLAYGKEAEDVVYSFLKERGWSLIPTVPFEEDRGQRVYRLDDDYPAVDTIAFKNGNSRWIEVKHKVEPCWFRNQWTTGMEKRYFNAYCQIEEDSGIPVYVFFVVDYTEYEDAPYGIFDKSLKFLKSNINSRSDTDFFWKISDLNFQGYIK